MIFSCVLMLSWGKTSALLTAGDRLLLEFGVAYALSAFSSTFGSAGVFLSRRCLPSVAKGDECVVYVDPDNRGWALCVSESERALYLNPGEIGQVLPAGAVKACELNLLPRRCFVRALPRINAFHTITSAHKVLEFCAHCAADFYCCIFFALWNALKLKLHAGNRQRSFCLKKKMFCIYKVLRWIWSPLLLWHLKPVGISLQENNLTRVYIIYKIKI